MANKPVMLIYGLWERNGSRGWTRLAPAIAQPKSRAVRTFQNALLAHALSGGAIPERRLIAVGHAVVGTR